MKLISKNKDWYQNVNAAKLSILHTKSLLWAPHMYFLSTIFHSQLMKFYINQSNIRSYAIFNLNIIKV